VDLTASKTPLSNSSAHHQPKGTPMKIRIKRLRNHLSKKELDAIGRKYGVTVHLRPREVQQHLEIHDEDLNQTYLGEVCSDDCFFLSEELDCEIAKLTHRLPKLSFRQIAELEKELGVFIKHSEDHKTDSAECFAVYDEDEVFVVYISSEDKFFTAKELRRRILEIFQTEF